MIECTKCGHPNLTGAVYCGECGALLLLAAASGPGEVPDQGRSKRTGGEVPDAAAKVGATWATLLVLEDGHALPLANRDEFTLGRSSDRQPAVPDIDLSAHHAYSRGVSRRHAVIRRRGSHVLLSDLDSANGTYINGKRLRPRREEPLANGDVISLGTLSLQIRLERQ